MKNEITFTRLSEIDPNEIATHMSDPRISEHMPLLTSDWDLKTTKDFVSKKESCWTQDGLGHWAILLNGQYVGWGGFQKEGDDWDFGLVLRPDAFGLGRRVTKKAIEFANADNRISSVTFLLPPTRKNLGALERLGAVHIGDVEHEGAIFHKFRLDTD